MSSSFDFLPSQKWRLTGVFICMCVWFLLVCAHPVSHSFDNLLCHSYKKKKKNATNTHTKILHLDPVQTVFQTPCSVWTEWTVGWLRGWVTSVKCRSTMLYFMLHFTEVEAICPERPHPTQNLAESSWLPFPGEELDVLRPPTPPAASSETSSPPYPYSLNASIQGALPPTNTFRTLWFWKVYPLTPHPAKSHDVFCSPKGMNLWTLCRHQCIIFV